MSLVNVKQLLEAARRTPWPLRSLVMLATSSSKICSHFLQAWLLGNPLSPGGEVLKPRLSAFTRGNGALSSNGLAVGLGPVLHH